MLFTETRATTQPECFRTVIDSTTRIDGRLNLRDSARIDGQVSGEVNLEGDIKATVAIGASGDVHGDITAHRVLVAGQVIGNIHAEERVELMSTARVNGDITYGSISIAHGAKVLGLLIERPDSAASAVKAA
jgi:cytoskeletal protein CcmA (bactofilin family)